MKRFNHLMTICILTSMLGACAPTIEKLERVGKPPDFEPIENPHVKPGYKPLSWPLPNPQAESPKYANALWRPGARSFFRDQRAARVGDILRVNVEINDRSDVINETRRQKDANETVSIPNLFGSVRNKIIPGGRNDPLISADSETETVGRAQLRRQERLNTQVSAIVTQVLPNGNLVIDGSQEILINFEVRVVGVKGIVRPQDIGSDNTVDVSQIAEARVTYGGRGQITDLQQPRYGYQILDAISPF